MTDPSVRSEPRCPIYKRCGGCRTMHLTDADRRSRAIARLRTALAHLNPGAESNAVELGSPSDDASFRCRLVLRVQGEGESLTTGLPARDHGLVDVDHCPVTSPLAMHAVQTTVQAARRFAIPGLCAFAAHAAADGARVLLTIVADSARVAHAQDLARAAFDAGVTSVAINQTEGRGRVLGRRTIPVAGVFPFIDDVDGLRLRIAGVSPFEPTHWSATRLADDVRAAIGDFEPRRAIVLRSGNGQLALMLARSGATVTAMEDRPEIAHEAIGSAHDGGFEKVTTPGIPNDAALTAASGTRPDLVVIESPRSGSEPARLAGIARLIAPPRILVVARTLDALASDPRALSDLGYRVLSARSHEADPFAGELTTVVMMTR